MTNQATIRIRSYAFPENTHAYWNILPSMASDTMPVVFAEYESLQEAEPDMLWTIEYRGEDSDWHPYGGYGTL